MKLKHIRGPARVAVIGFFFQAALAVAGLNRWTTGGPGGGAVELVVIDPTSPSTIYAVTPASGLFNTTDRGDTWTGIGSGLENLNIRNLVIDPITPSRLYAGTDRGVFTTTDGGLSWTVTGLASSVRGLAVNPSAPSMLYAGTDGGVFKTIDGGLNWTATGLSSGVSALVIDPTTPTTLYATDACTFCPQRKSMDGGQTWEVLAKSPGGILAIDPSTPATLYVGTPLFCFLGCSGGVSKSTDGGSSWKFTSLSTTGVVSLTVDPVAPMTLYAGADNFSKNSRTGLLKSTDGGSSWVSINQGLPSHGLEARTLSVAIDPLSDATLFIGREDGIFRSQNSGGSWQRADTGVANAQVSGLAIDPIRPATLYAATSAGGYADSDRTGLYKSTDGGLSWNATSLKGDSLFVAIDPTAPSTLYASGYTDGSIFGIYKSVDAGASWFSINDVLTLGDFITGIVIDPSQPTTVYAISVHSGLLKSTSGGNGWTSLQGSLGASVSTFAIDPIRASTLYAGTVGGGVFKSADAGATWSGVNEGLPDGLSVAALVVDPAAPTTLYCGSSGVWKSMDAGGHWAAASSGLPADVSVVALAIDRAAPATVYAGTQSSGVFRSTDAGSSWSTFDVGLTNLNVTALAIDPTGTNLHAATAGGGVLDYQVFVPSPCNPGPTTLCLGHTRFSVKADWRSPSQVSGGHGIAVSLSGDTGYFWFFSSSNIEMIVKVLDGCGVNGHEWVFAGGLTDVEVTLTITDTQTGEVKTYVNPAGVPFQPIQDTAAFSSCPSGSVSSVFVPQAAQQTEPALRRGLAEPPIGRRFDSRIEACPPDGTTLCLSGGRFWVQAGWRIPSQEASGQGAAVPLTADTGYFWFFNASNVELIVKVLDACSFNAHKWVFAGGLTNVEVTLTVTDMQTGAVRTYVNPANTPFLPIQDTAAFGTCP